jgi:hypothetical protein
LQQPYIHNTSFLCNKLGERVIAHNTETQINNGEKYFLPIYEYTEAINEEQY